MDRLHMENEGREMAVSGETLVLEENEGGRLSWEHLKTKPEGQGVLSHKHDYSELDLLLRILRTKGK